MSEAFGERLKSARIVRRLSQKQVAEICGMTQQSVNRLENGKHKPRQTTIELLAYKLDAYSEFTDFLQKESDFTNESIPAEILKSITYLSPEGLKELDHFINNMLLTNTKYRKAM